MAEEANPGVTTPPVEPAAPAASAQPTPHGNEPVTNSGSQPEQTVPFTRFQEVNDRAKQAEDELRQLREQQQTPPALQTGDDDLDPEVEELIRKGAKKLGLVSQQELATQNMQLQVRQDIKDLEANPPIAGIPYDNKAVMDYAKANNLPITSKAAFIAAYKELNWDKLIEAERQRAIDDFKTGASSAAEKPGSEGARPPEEPEVSGKTPKERTKSRISLARQKLRT